MTICYFTATGNSLYVAKRIGGTLLSIPKLMKENEIIIEDDSVGIISPVYAGNSPVIVRKFLQKAKIKTDYLFFTCTYGMSYSVAKVNAISTANELGLKLNYVNVIKMVDNYLPGFDIKKQVESAHEKNIEGQIDNILKDISSRKKNVTGITLLQKVAKWIVNNTMGKVLFDKNTAKKYVVDNNCILCGTCAKVCPANNISVNDKVIFADKGEVCYACIHNCPKRAIHVKFEKSKDRFRNEHISLNEIIEANI